MACKQVLPIMREQRSGVILTISSLAAWEQYPYVAYKATKAGLIAFTQQVAIQNAEYGIWRLRRPCQHPACLYRLRRPTQLRSDASRV